MKRRKSEGKRGETNRLRIVLISPCLGFVYQLWRRRELLRSLCAALIFYLRLNAAKVGTPHGFFLISNGGVYKVSVRPLGKLGHRRPGPGRIVSAERDPRSRAPPGNYRVRQTHQTRKDPLLTPLPLCSSLLYLFPSRLPCVLPGFFFFRLVWTLQTRQKTDHAMTERALGTSTESITGGE